MATVALNNVGQNAAALSPGVNIVANAADVAYLLVNDTDATVTLTLNPGTGVIVEGGNTHTVQAKSYTILSVSNGATVRTMGITANSVKTAHGTSAQSGEDIYLIPATATAP